MKKIIFILVIIVSATAAIAENTIDLDKADFEWILDGDDLTISISAETKGWIAVGLGSSRMDGSTMFFGFVKNETVYFEEHLGKGHSHKKTEVQRPVVYELSEVNGITSMSFTVSKSDFAGSGSNSLPVIVAWGTRDSFTSLHRYRDAAEIIF
ncbi:MAG: DOMON domain-containing protein [Spirochaetales bacterium]|uniref:DOMON domain-containing protein n=1 Tax=Candidatus Thalassospirochaeta sargassi TaxID=3119039 RepID=A0AAJ1IHH9_9SPIO|nr:DOMON domain-containing protein [Spirochaetales bacterium]